jgi:hypothetical protein
MCSCNVLISKITHILIFDSFAVTLSVKCHYIINGASILPSEKMVKMLHQLQHMLGIYYIQSDQLKNSKRQ